MTAATPVGSGESTTRIAATSEGARALHRWTVGAALGLCLSAHQVYRAHALYMAPARHGAWGAAAALTAAALAAAVARRSAGAACAQLPWLFLGSGLLTSTLSVVPFIVFDDRIGSSAAPALGVLVGALLVLLASRAAWLAVGRQSLRRGLVEYLQSPVRVLALSGGALAVVMGFAHVGFARSGLCTSAALFLLAVSYQGRHQLLRGAPLAHARALRGATCLGAALVLGEVVATVHALPLAELSRYTDEIVFARDGEVHRLVVVAAPGGYELFRDGQLAVASLDEHRRTAALVRPALHAADRHGSVLLLHGGTGTVEHAILTAPGTASLTVVAEEPLLPRLARGMPWLAALGDGALDDARVHLVVAEPTVWLAAHRDTYDVVIDDLPAPTGYREGKHYTTHYLGLLAAHVAPGGLVVVPAASAFGSNDAFSTVVATMRAAGLRPTPYHAAVPTLGVASFVVGASRAEDAELLRGTPGISLDEGSDLSPHGDGVAATLHDQRVVSAFQDARERR
jgi:spermidine synthase